MNGALYQQYQQTGYEDDDDKDVEMNQITLIFRHGFEFRVLHDFELPRSRCFRSFLV